ncbi:protein-export membrane protein SecD [Amylibacter kogurei]|uniref:Protein translocase subunit SecD n=1 Tax=Paramylibacter kogurei TaxID=1889778 RepID=A0A2G5K499_9RHOB|nr:protein translocase subunit SecD [Amylibacter kogurei]PIB24356.1 protein-export membrane protein SecD [Amylibacter kogurei]
MLQFSLWKKIVIWGLCALGILLAIPNGFYDRVEQSNDANVVLSGGLAANPEIGAMSGAELETVADQWPSWMPSSLVNLGLDLRGGAHLLAAVQVGDVYATRMDDYWQQVLGELRGERATIGTIRRVDAADGELRVRISKPEQMERALELVRGLASPIVTLSGAGSNDIEARADGDVIVITMSEAEILATNDRTMAQSLEIVRRRVDEAGTREPIIQRQGEDRILIQVPGIGSAEELKSLIGKTAKLTFHPVAGRTSDENTRLQARQILLPAGDEQGVFYILDKTPVITGDHLVDASAQFDQNNRPAVGFRLNTTGGKIFGEYTANNIGQPFAIVLDEEVVSAPTIQSHISGGSGIITGNFSVEETTNLSIQLRAGALPAGLTYLEERTIGPELGQDSIDAGALACMVAFGAVLVFMFLSYGLFGLFANVALIINVALIFGLLSAIGATLTLPGIAGIVLTIGMAVDANVLVFERIREELKAAKGPARAIELGYERAFSAIIDANITTLIAAIILFVMGSGPVRGFAVTLGLGIVTSVFTAIWVTRLIISTWLAHKRPKTIDV